MTKQWPLHERMHKNFKNKPSGASAKTNTFFFNEAAQGQLTWKIELRAKFLLGLTWQGDS
jgi:hypothetical protein